MPIINVTLLEDVFSQEEKAEVITNVTDAMVKIKGEGFRGVTKVVINEVASGNVGFGGQVITSEAARSLSDKKEKVSA